jgi:glycosyltransferase involved in cell wall biosynthesis
MADRASTIGIRDPRSIGISRYVARLADAMHALGEPYLPADGPQRGARLHFHLGNSSRRVVWQSRLARPPYVVTVHDVIPRTRALMALYRTAVYPLCVRRAARVIVHSEFAAQLLVDAAHVDPATIEVIAFPASDLPRSVGRVGARRELGLRPDGPPLFVLPGVVKAAKLVTPVLDAAQPLIAGGRAQLLLVGPVADARIAEVARRIGASLIDGPADREYDLAIVAADCVLNLRAGSVGESNGPLLDAIGAHRAVLATDNGSIREVAGGAAAFVRDTTAEAIADGMRALLDPGSRTALSRAAARRAAELTWDASARRHAALLASVYEP